MALKIKSVRQKQLRMFSLVKQSLLAFMNGAMPQVAVEFGRKTIPSRERPTIDTVENETIAGPAPAPEVRGQGGGLAHAPRGTRKLAASAPWLQGAQPDSAGQAIERLPGLAFAFEQFALNIPAAAGSLLKLEAAPTLEAIRPERRIHCHG